MKKIVIVLAGEIKSAERAKAIIQEADYLIACDGGADHLLDMGLEADIYLGDFDSISEKAEAHIRDLSRKRVSFPSEKDETDSELALNHALSLVDAGEKAEIVFLAAFGSRFDHVLSNLFMLAERLRPGLSFVLSNGLEKVSLLQGPETRRFEASAEDLELELKRYFSLLPYGGDCCGITLGNCKYPLNNATLSPGNGRGISNEAIDPTKEISLTFKSGRLIIAEMIEIQLA